MRGLVTDSQQAAKDDLLLKGKGGLKNEMF
jgi:hypothetical protein